jgi:mRNA interferase MazF
MKRQFDVWLADLSPRFGTEAGKTRPVLIVQSDLLNAVHPSTLICPITSNVQPGSNILRVHILAGMAGLKVDSDVMIDQIRAIDNRRLVSKIGTLQAAHAELVKTNLRVVMRL